MYDVILCIILAIVLIVIGIYILIVGIKDKSSDPEIYYKGKQTIISGSIFVLIGIVAFVLAGYVGLVRQ
jgi:hypothetical protein